MFINFWCKHNSIARSRYIPVHSLSMVYMQHIEHACIIIN